MRTSLYSQLNDREWLLARYAETQNATLIATEVGCTATAVIRALRRFGVTPRPRGGRNALHIPQLEDREWLARAISEKSREEIARELGCSRPLVTRALRSFDLGIYRPNRPPQLDDASWLTEAIRSKTERRIAEELGCTHSTVKAALRRYGLRAPHRKKYQMTVDKSDAVKRGLARASPGSRYGSKASNWRGGRVIRSNYVFLHRELVEARWPDHPRLAQEGWTHKQEHVLVLEASLGHCLSPKQRVEHDNGIKTDNRLKNLKLMGSGGEHIRQHFGYGERTRRAEREAKQLKAEVRKLRRKVRELERQGAANA